VQGKGRGDVNRRRRRIGRKRKEKGEVILQWPSERPRPRNWIRGILVGPESATLGSEGNDNIVKDKWREFR